MDDKNKQSRLNNQLDIINPTNYAIKTFTPKFREGQKHTIVPLKISGNSTLKGTKILFMKKSKKRYFRLSYWFQDQSLTLPCGLFRDEVYGIKELEEYLKPIAHAWHSFSTGSSEAALEAVLKTRKEERLYQSNVEKFCISASY